MKNELMKLQDQTTPSTENMEMLTFTEACIYLKISKSFLYKATAERTIPFFKPTGGKLIYFSRYDLDAWLTQNRHASKQELEASVNNINKTWRA
jgi:excisionase family DNA binding protein